MAYQRKTEDEYHLVYDYGYGDGPEVLARYENIAEARRDRQLYIENEGICPVIKKRRIPKGEFVYGKPA